MEEKRILAKDARQVADTTTKFINRIYKAIREESEEGTTFLDWSLFGLSETLAETTVKQLTEDGYMVRLNRDPSSNNELCGITIRW